MLSEEDVPGAHFSRDPAEYSVLELKRWLECHGEKKSGRKQELIERIRSCILLKKGIDPKVDYGKWPMWNPCALRHRSVADSLSLFFTPAYFSVLQQWLA